MVLTDVRFRGGTLSDHASEEEEEVAEDDEGRGDARAAEVLLNQLVPLEFPDSICVVLHLLKGIAVGTETASVT